MSRQNLLAFLVIACVGFGIYANSLKNEFVWDDKTLVSQNPYIKEAKYIKDIFTKGYLSAEEIQEIIKKPSNMKGRFYRPIQALTYAVDYWFWGNAAYGYRFTNMVIHILNAILVFLIVGRIGGLRLPALLASLFFCSHPAFVAAVSYISGRADVLYFFFSMASYYLFLCCLFKEQRKGIYYIASLLLFLLGLLSKEMALFVLALFFITLVLYGKKAAGGFKKQTLIFVGYLFVAVIYFILRTMAVGSAPEPELTGSLNIFYRLLCGACIFTEYLGILMFPFALYMDRTLYIFSLSVFGRGDFLLTYLIFFGFIISLFFMRKTSQKTAYFGGLWFLSGFLMISNIFIPLNAPVAEHWLYMPSVGFFIFIIFLVKDFILVKIPASCDRMVKVGLSILVVFYLSFFSVRTILRNMDWKNEEVLFKQTSRFSNNPRSFANLSNVYAARGDYNKALEVLDGQKGKRMQPTREFKASMCLYRSMLYKKLNRLNEAAMDLEMYLNLNPKDAEIYNDLGNLYDKIGNKEKAVSCWQRALQLNPDLTFLKERIGSYKR